MKTEKILLPLDVGKCPLEIFELVDSFARRPEVTVILLHVVNLNIVSPLKRVFDELAAEAKSYLDRLADRQFSPSASITIHVRQGEPAAEILAEAANEKPDLIILPTYGASFWNRLKSLWKPACNPVISPMVERVVRQAKCAVFVVAAKTCFNCAQAWGHLGTEKARSTSTIALRQPAGFNHL